MTKIGCNWPHFDVLNAGVGNKLSVVRYFDQGQKWTDAAFNTCREFAAKGHELRVSLKPVGTWAQVANGTDDVRINGIIAGLKSLGVPVTIAIQHEPENDNQPSADFIKMQLHFLSMTKAASIRSAIVLMGWSFRDTGTTDTWVGSAKPDVLAADTYDWKGSNTAPVDGWAKPGNNGIGDVAASVYGKQITYCNAKGFRPELWEFGVARHQSDASGAQRTASIQKIADYAKGKFDSVCYFDLNRGERGCTINWVIDGEPASMAAFASMYQATTPVPPTPVPGDCADVEAELAAVKVELANQEAANDDLLVQLNTTQAERDKALAQIAAAVDVLT